MIFPELVPRVGVPAVRHKTFAPWGGASILISLLNVVHCVKGGVLGERMSISPTCIHTVLLFIGVEELFSYFSGIFQRVVTFQVSFRGDCSICSCIFSGFMGGGELRFFLCHHLEPPSTFTFNEKNKKPAVIFVIVCSW